MRERGGRESWRGLPSKLSPFSFLSACVSIYRFMSACFKLKVSLFLSFSSPLFLRLSPFILCIPLCMLWIWGGLTAGVCLRGKKKECRSSVFSSFFHNDAEQEMEMITSSSAPLHHLLFLKPWEEALCALPNPPFRPFFLNAGGWLKKDVALIFTLHSPTS